MTCECIVCCGYREARLAKERAEREAAYFAAMEG
jgi:hypothetical protein